MSIKIESVESAPFAQVAYLAWRRGRKRGRRGRSRLRHAVAVGATARRGTSLGGDPQHTRARRSHCRQRGHEGGVSRRAARDRPQRSKPACRPRSKPECAVRSAADKSPRGPPGRRRRTLRGGGPGVRGARDSRSQSRLGGLRLPCLRPARCVRRRRPLRRLDRPNRPGWKHADPACGHSHQALYAARFNA